MGCGGICFFLYENSGKMRNDSERKLKIWTHNLLTFSHNLEKNISLVVVPTEFNQEALVNFNLRLKVSAISLVDFSKIGLEIHITHYNQTTQ